MGDVLKFEVIEGGGKQAEREYWFEYGYRKGRDDWCDSKFEIALKATTLDAAIEEATEIYKQALLLNKQYRDARLSERKRIDLKWPKKKVIFE